MTKLTEKILDAGFCDQILTEIDLSSLLDGTPAARFGMVNKALKKKELIKIRRGLYLQADKYRHKKISKFFLASLIVSHSYISFESALSYYGWIPEYVSVVTSVIAHGRTKQFKTFFGEFAFFHLPINEYEFLTSVTRVEEIKGEPFLIASPLRALIDLIYLKKIDWNGLDLLTNSFRIDREKLMAIDSNQFLEIKRVYRSNRVLHFLDNLKKELQNNA